MAEPGADAERRLVELERVNSELAAELRRLEAGRAASPRRGAIPTGRGLGRLRDELAVAGAETAELRRQNEELEQHNRELGEALHQHAEYGKRLFAEIDRLESGPVGRLRRLWDRLTRAPRLQRQNRP